MRVAFLLQGLMPYQDAAFRALAALGDEVLLVHPEEMPDTAFDREALGSWAPRRLVWSAAPPPKGELLAHLEEFRPDVIMMTSWRGRSYRAAMAAFRGRALRVMFSSNFWRGTPRQWLGKLTRRVAIEPLFDAAFVPGERSETFVRHLGFGPERVIRGANTADVAVFDRGPRSGDDLAACGRFLFSGRLVEHKAVDVLADAYRSYREQVPDPWALSVVGQGPLATRFEGIPGVELHGFLQQRELAELMHRSSCLVLPSYIDFWGVVVHEAAVAGLALLCSDGVGATPYLLQDGFNGWVVAAGDRASLATGMRRVSTAGAARLGEMSAGSAALARRLSPAIWARNFHEETERRLAELRSRAGR